MTFESLLLSPVIALACVAGVALAALAGFAIHYFTSSDPEED
jgi:branched-subunit amino acid ABC-type transport system permease component